MGSFGALEVFSFHATKTLGCTEGGCIATNDDDLASRLRNIRSSYGAGAHVDVPITTNGRFSEAQACLALLALDDLEANVGHNEELFRLYCEALGGIGGLRVFRPVNAERSNYQSLVCEIDGAVLGLTRDELWQTLRAEGVRARRYFYPGAHRSEPYDRLLPRFVKRLPVTDRLCSRMLQLPLGALVSLEVAERISSLVVAIAAEAPEVASGLRNRA